MGLIKALLGKPDKDDFARIVMKALKDNAEKIPISYNPGEFKLSIGGDSGVEFFLHNAYSDYLRSSRSQRKEVLHQYLQATKTWVLGIVTIILQRGVPSNLAL
jgi:hypothetical protein